MKIFNAMGLRNISKYIFLAANFIMLLGGNTFPQNTEYNSQQDSIISQADSLFSIKNYVEALPYYQNLVNDYPQDASFIFKLGVSTLNATRNINNAIELLSKASTLDVPNLVYFYLGEAYRFSYQFDEAISYYRRFTLNGGDKEIPKELVEQKVNQCDNGKFMLKYLYQPNIKAKESVASDKFHQYIITKSSRGTFVVKPNDLKTKNDVNKGDSSIIFYPLNPQVGDKIFFASYGTSSMYGKDIFMIEYQSDGFWSKPQNLGEVVNSDQDEDFPYLSPDGVTLYFASKGHYSMGGFDIYRSIYSPSTNQWSTPENLGFPFSSPFNDYLFVPNEANTQACFVTDRNVVGNMIEVVLLEIEENPIRKTVTNHETLLSVAKLEPAQSAGKASTEVATKKPKKQQAASFNAVENDPEYMRVLAKGFSEQMKADTARIELEKLREKFDYISTADERRSLEAKVVAMENKLLDAQRNADTYFAQASQIEQEYLTGKRKPSDKPTSTFTTDKPEFLYQAQFASTVFQTDELNKLARVEKLFPQIEIARKQALSAKSKMQATEGDSTGYASARKDFIENAKEFNNLASNYVDTKKTLYRECISVALVKRGVSDENGVKAEIDRANNHFWGATAIRNNLTEETKIESQLEALLLDELGIYRLELAFAKIWGIHLFEQELLSKIYRQEQDIFGKTLAKTETKATVQETKPAQTNQVALLEPTNEIIETQIEFRPEEEPSFQVLEKLPYNKENPIPSHLPLPDGVIYKIQLAAFSNPVGNSVFKGLYPLSKEPVNNGRVTKYYAGMFKTLADAQKALPTVHSKGFRDAFIAAWHNGRSVQLNRAEEMEGFSTPNAKPNVDIKIEEDSNKLYLVQIGTYKGKLPDDIAQTVRALAPGKDLVRETASPGSFVYSISSFATASEAQRVKDNLITSGINNAMVITVDIDK